MNWTEALRLGCEVARLHYMSWAHEYRYTYRDKDGDLCVAKLREDEPALPAYAADLLVAQCCETDEGKRLYRWTFDEISDPDVIGEIWERDVATSRQRILAALVSRGKLTRDDAKTIMESLT